jgi:hypothetical protein
MMQGQASKAQAETAALSGLATATTTSLQATSTMGTPEAATAAGGEVTGTETGTQGHPPVSNPNIPLPGQAAQPSLLVGTDSDADGLTDAEELALGTNIQNKDTDGDGFSDGSEVSKGYDPLAKGAKIADSAGIKSETVGDIAILLPKSWERQAGSGGTISIKTGTPSTFTLSMQTFAAGGSLLDWVVAQNMGSAASDFTAAKNANGLDVVYSNDGMTAWLLQGNTVTVFRYATNDSTTKDFGSLFKLMVDFARAAK